MSRGRVHLSAGYAEWLRQADAAAQEQGIIGAPSLERFEIEIALSERFIGRGGDAQNRLKAVCDWCEKWGLILDDGDCRMALIEWMDIGDRDCVVVLRGTISDTEYARVIAERRR